jgi:hypothetical protein
MARESCGNRTKATPQQTPKSQQHLNSWLTINIWVNSGVRARLMILFDDFVVFVA